MDRYFPPAGGDDPRSRLLRRRGGWRAGRLGTACSLLRPSDIVATTTRTRRRGCHTDAAGWGCWRSSPGRGHAARIPHGWARHEPQEDDRAGKSVRFVFRRRSIRRSGALAQWQSSGLLTHWFRVRPPGAPRSPPLRFIPAALRPGALQSRTGAPGSHDREGFDPRKRGQSLHDHEASLRSP